MSVDYRAGLAFGIAISSDEMHEGLENIANTIKSKDLPDWFSTDEEFENWRHDMIYNEDYSELKELLYEDDILINLDGYCDSAGYILGYSIDYVDWGCKPFVIGNVIDNAEKMKSKIFEWYHRLFPDKDFPEPQLLLYSQVW